jgi:hypothetical protein
VTRGGLTILAIATGFFVYKNSWHFKDIFREIEAFVMISILFEGIFRDI